MKTISFFSEKGGVGKSSFSIMYASWLHYKHGISVAVADFNSRIETYRKAEIKKRSEQISKDADVRPFNIQTSWPIFSPKQKEIIDLRKQGAQMPYATWFQEKFLKNYENKYDVVLCDFPGSLTGNEFINISGAGLINYVVIPTEKDQMTLQSTLHIHAIVGRKNHSVFINKAQLGLRPLRTTYFKLAELLVKNGLPMLPDMISYSERMTSLEKLDNIRSTFGFPNFDDPEFGSSKDLGIENLFIDVTKELSKCPDLQSTGFCDLSFVDGLQKKNDGRQFTGSSYPQYEI